MRTAPRLRSLATLVVLALAAGCTSSSSSHPTSTSNRPPEGTEGSSPTTTSATTNATTTTGASTPATDSSVPLGPDPDVRQGTLPNGLKYYIRKNDNPGGSAELRLAVNAGSAEEDADQSGVAHFLEHMMFNGTQKFPKNDLIDVLRASGSQFGADINATTTFNETVFQLNVDTKAAGPLDTGLDVLQQWLSAATLTDADVVAERGVVLDEWRQRQQTSDGRIQDALTHTFLDGTPFADREPIGTDTAIQAMTPDLLRRFYDQWYRPDNAAVVVVGDIDVDAVEQGIKDRFTPLQPRTSGALPEAPSLQVDTKPRATVVSDPDLTKASVELTLPLAAVTPSIASSQSATVDQLIFDMIANRLSDDAALPGKPFDDAYVSDNDIVRELDAPSIVVDSKIDKVTDSMQALLDEFERVRRFGFDEQELQRAVKQAKAQADAQHAGRDTIQDRDFAQQYVTSFLTGGPVLSEDASYSLTTKALAQVTTADAKSRFLQRWGATAPRLAVYAPNGTAGVPTQDAVLAAIAALPQRDLQARPAQAATSGGLMTAPSPVQESAAKDLAGVPEIYLTSPRLLTFPNGVRVVINPSPEIAAGQSVLLAESAGGMADTPDAQLADASVAVDAVTSGGVDRFNKPALDQRLAGSTAQVQMSIDRSTDSIYGTAATTDVETMLQLIHLYMTSPRFDQVALDHTLTPLLADAKDPNADQGTAAYNALTTSRYGSSIRFGRALTAGELGTVTSDGIAAVWKQQFQNLSDWVFVIAGDVKVDDVTKLAREYLGTLTGTGTSDKLTDIVPPPPPGIVKVPIQAGTGDKGELLRTYSVDVPGDVQDTLLAEVASEVTTARLLQDIREALGASYSPNASFNLDPSVTGGKSHLSVLVDVPLDPASLAKVSDRVTADLTDLATKGPSDDDVSKAVAVVMQQDGLISNELLGQVLLDEQMGFGPTASDLIGKLQALSQPVPTDAVAAFLAATLPADQFIEIDATPR